MMFILRFNYINYIVMDGDRMAISGASGKSKPFVNVGDDKKLEKQSAAKALKNGNYELAGKIIGVKISRDNLSEGSILNSKTEKRLDYAEKNSQISTALFKYIDGSKNKTNLLGVINNNTALSRLYYKHSNPNANPAYNPNGFTQPTREELNNPIENKLNSRSAPDKNKETASHLTPKEKKSKPKISFENKHEHSDKRAETSVQTKRITTSPTLKKQEKVMVGQSTEEVIIDNKINVCKNDIDELSEQINYETKGLNKIKAKAELSELKSTRSQLLIERARITKNKWTPSQIESRKNELTFEIESLKGDLKEISSSSTSGMQSQKNGLIRKQLEAETLLKRLNGQA